MFSLSQISFVEEVNIIKWMMKRRVMSVSKPIFPELKRDFKASWSLFRENWKAYIGNELFALIIAPIVVILFYITERILLYFIPALAVLSNYNANDIMINLIAIFIAILANIFFLCQFGLEV